MRTSPARHSPTIARSSSVASASTEARWKTLPSTAARSSTRRSSVASWSRRVASRSWIDGGTRTSERSPVATQPPSSFSRSPSSISMLSISSTKSAFPAEAPWMRARTSAESVTPPTRLSISASASSLGERLEVDRRRVLLAAAPVAAQIEQLGPRRGRRAGSACRARTPRRARSGRAASARPSGGRRTRRSAAGGGRAPRTAGARPRSPPPRLPTVSLDADHLRHALGDELRRVVPFRAPPRSSRARRRRSSSSVSPVGLLHDLAHRPEGDPLAVGQAGARQHQRRSAPMSRSASCEEPRLADARPSRAA